MPKTHDLHHNQNKRPTAAQIERRRTTAASLGIAGVIGAALASNSGEVARNVRSLPDFLRGQFAEYEVPQGPDPYRSVKIGDEIRQ